MKQSFIAFLALALVCPFAAAGQGTADVLNKDTGSKFALFDTAVAAQNHCPFDFVVWLNTVTGTYNIKGPLPTDDRRSGAYMCQREADQMDYHPQ